MKKKRKMTKRQLLNALLEGKEKKDKLYESQKRLWTAEKKLLNIHRKLAQQLADIDYKERSKDGDRKKQPIMYKGHTFNPEASSGWSSHASCEIIEVSSVR